MAISAAKKLDARTIRIPGLGTGQFSQALSVVQDRIVKHLFDFILGDLQALKEFKGLEIQYRFPYVCLWTLVVELTRLFLNTPISSPPTSLLSSSPSTSVLLCLSVFATVISPTISQPICLNQSLPTLRVW